MTMRHLAGSFRLHIIRCCFLATIFFSPLPGLSQKGHERDRLQPGQEVSKPTRLNNKSFQKNLEKYAHQLDLTSKQVKKINRIEKKYNRKETRLARKPSTKKKQLRSLQKEKRERMIAVLDYNQQQTLQRLSRSGFWDFVRLKQE